MSQDNRYFKMEYLNLESKAIDLMSKASNVGILEIFQSFRMLSPLRCKSPEF